MAYFVNPQGPLSSDGVIYCCKVQWDDTLLYQRSCSWRFPLAEITAFCTEDIDGRG